MPPGLSSIVFHAPLKPCRTCATQVSVQDLALEYYASDVGVMLSPVAFQLPLTQACPYTCSQVSVEDLALEYYSSDAGGRYQGVHSEGGVWATLFGLLM